MERVNSTPMFTGRITQVALLLLPITLMTFSACILVFVEKLFFARLSAEMMEIGLNVGYVCRVFQAPCLSLAMMAQVYVGTLFGAGKDVLIGSRVWQFIWFSFLSTLITVPLSLLYGHVYFDSTVLAGGFSSYFYFLVFMNFLYPLGASLTCFYIGLGKTRFVLMATLMNYLVNLGLAYLLIFGVEGWIPSLGLIGGALSFFIAQGGYCLALLGLFLSSRHAQKYGTRCWTFKPKLFWECIHPGLLRAINRISVFLCWASIAHLMIGKAGDYLLIWSVGGTLVLFLPFIGEAVCQALTTMNSQLLGAKKYELMGQLDRCAHRLVIPILGLAAIPMLFFPGTTFQLLFPELSLPGPSITKLFLGLWLAFSYWTLSYIPASRILAFKDAHFFLFVASFSWISSFGLLYVAIHLVQVPADQCWIILSFSNLVDLGLFSWRAHYLLKHQTQLESGDLQMPCA